MVNQNPEQIARDRIDEMLEASGWAVQDKNEIDWSAGRGVAIREYTTDIGPADYVLFVNREPMGIVEAKKGSEGQRLTVAEDQSKNYAEAKLKHLNNEALNYVYQTTGEITRFTDYSDPKPRARPVFSFHRPETLAGYQKKEKSLRRRLFDLPALDVDGLRPAQIIAVQQLERSFQENRPKALIQMATGAGKTFTAATFIYRLLKHADAKRILFLVDTKNLGEQAEQEFQKYQPKDDNRKFVELYNVQRLNSSHIASDSQVCISTIQRLYSILKDEELDESNELENPNERGSWLEEKLKSKEPPPVVYNEKVPIEQFDFIVIDECHRSIYNLWKQVLDYFDAFLIGLTATPDKRTFGFFNENVVSEYTYEESVTDGVNVPHEVYLIDTRISKEGDKIKSGWFIDRRDKMTRRKRWQQEEEDTEYARNDLDKKVVNVSQIRQILQEFRKALETKIFPERIATDGSYEVPKTLIFAKTDSHADDIIRIIREVFAEGNEFCKKVTYKSSEDPKTVLNRFRNSYYPRIAVTVDMIATGTDVKPLEVLLFMRDVRSTNYFEQMKGRGTRSIDHDKLQEVSSAAITKTHFVIVDAVGATKSKKTDSRPLERQRSVAMKELLSAVTMGVNEEDVFLSLANRLIRLDRQITDKEKSKIGELSGGKNLRQMTKELIAAHDPDQIDQATIPFLEEKEEVDRTPQFREECRNKAKKQLARAASTTFNGALNEYIDNVRKQHEQLIDHINLDEVTFSGWDADASDTANELVQEFAEYLKANKDEITALSIYFDQPYQRRTVAFSMIKDVMEMLRTAKPKLAPHRVWDAYASLEGVKGTRPESELSALVSLIRKVCGLDSELTNYQSVVDKNFQDWVFQKQAGALKFSEEQMDWLRMLKEHVANSFHVETDDLDYTPFDAKGGRGGMFQVFGEQMGGIIEELNEVLVA